MYVLVLALGVLAAAAGVIATGWGITIKEFSLGSTLLIAGTTSIIGGIVIIGVAGAIRELRRIAQVLSTPRPMPRYPRPGEAPEPFVAGAARPGTGAPRPAAPLPPVLPRRRSDEPGADLRAAEPPLAAMSRAAPAMAPPATREPVASPDRAKPELATQAVRMVTETFVVEESDAFPLSPQQPQRGLGEDMKKEPAEKPREPGIDRGPDYEQLRATGRGTDETANPDEARSDIQVTAPQNGDQSESAEREHAHLSSRELPFDTIWPASGLHRRTNEDAAAEQDAAADQTPETSNRCSQKSILVYLNCQI